MDARLRWLLPPVITAVIQVGFCLLAARNQPLARPIDAIAVAILVAGPAALLARRRWPVLALVGTAIATVGYFTSGYPGGPAFVAFLFAIGAAMQRGHRLAAWTVTAASYLAFLLVSWLQADLPPVAMAAGIAAWLLVALTVTEVFRARRERIAQDRRARAEQAKRQASEERLRIARELHDVLAHHVSLINVQAGTALHLLDDQPELARGALTAIKSSSKEVLVELRSLLGVLRRVDEDLPRQPTPTLERLDDIVDGVRASGLAVQVERPTDPPALPLGVDTAALRIIQEALTNVRRHAGAAAATVRLDYRSDRLVVQVDDDGAGSPDGLAEGTGIAGMRERARALGGSLHAGRKEDGGFRVHADLPLDDVPLADARRAETPAGGGR